MKRPQKEELVKKLSKELKEAASVVLVNYAGLSVKNQQELKRELKKIGAKMSVVKNTLFKLAAETVKAPKEALTDTVLSGPTAIIITEDDPIAPLQVLAKFAKAHGQPQFKVGVVGSVFQDQDALIKLSRLPGKEILLGQAVGAISAPLYGLMATLQGNMQKLVFILEQHSQSKSQN